ncbi:hypothetical protein NQ318_016450 [Aromia moschata]|uniref:Uncharacterized protein n=1 Tax=Aromia moschata TaxID=1265417 RepID=A0AAV8Z442_9CUCU|nr:hypothetical protein NQ318_016450 [Aromia moschata]
MASYLSVSHSSTTSCTCWEGYRAEYNQSGAQCVALNQFHIMPCNMAKAPKCQCSGRVSSILKDRTGTNCRNPVGVQDQLEGAVVVSLLYKEVT